MRRFVLNRHEDATGVSSALAGKPAVGVVAWGVAFDDGVCVTRWCISDIRQTCVWASLDDLLAVHGHAGKTELVWIDAENNRSGLAAYYGERLDAYRSVMERLQWCASGAHGRPMCPECCRRSDVGHRPDCGVAAVLGRPTVTVGHL